MYTVDLAVQMPNVSVSASPASIDSTPSQDLFQEKDYLNGRFFHKRAFYLSVIAAHIKEHLPVDVFYDSTNSGPRLPSLLIQSKEGSSCSYTFTENTPLFTQTNPSLTFLVQKRGYASWQR